MSGARFEEALHRLNPFGDDVRRTDSIDKKSFPELRITKSVHEALKFLRIVRSLFYYF